MIMSNEITWTLAIWANGFCAGDVSLQDGESGDDWNEEGSEKEDMEKESGNEEEEEVPKKESAGEKSELLEAFKLVVENQKESLRMVMKKANKRKRRGEEEDDEDEEVEAGPKLISIKNHHFKDDAHSVIDWKVRTSIRPFNGEDRKKFWEKMPRRAEPALEDIQLGHLTKAPINPAVIKKLHDRGTKTAGKQWLSTNFSVEDKGGRVKFYDDRTAGAFLLDYEDSKGPWEAIDGIFNYAMALRMIRPEDDSGILLLRTLHECRMFNHPKFGVKVQRELIMALFDQVGGNIWGTATV